MSDYPPEVQAVLDAIAPFRVGNVVTVADVERLRHVADAYRKATAPPEPFEWFMFRFGDIWDDALYDEQPRISVDASSVLWRCTVTPIERVRP